MTTTRIFGSVIAFFVLFSVVASAPVEAKTKTARTTSRRVGYDLYNRHKRYGDEKVTIADPSSRCDTAANKKAHEANVAQAKKDASAFHPDSDPRISEIYRTYMTKLDLAWGAMEEPYCGFGAFGNSAAKKSYDKTVARARTEFLTEARKTQVALQK